MSTQNRCDACGRPSTLHVATIHHGTKYNFYFCGDHIPEAGREILPTMERIGALQKENPASPELTTLKEKFDNLLKKVVQTRFPAHYAR